MRVISIVYWDKKMEIDDAVVLAQWDPPQAAQGDHCNWHEQAEQRKSQSSAADSAQTIEIKAKAP